VARAAAPAMLDGGRARSGVARETTSGPFVTEPSQYTLDRQTAEGRAYARGRPWGDDGYFRAPMRYDYNDRRRRSDDYYNDRPRNDYSYSRSRGYGYNDRDYYRGRRDDYGFLTSKSITEAMLYFTSADVGLRILAFYYYSQAAGEYGWFALWLFLCGQVLISRNYIYDGFSGFMTAIGSSLVSAFPLVVDSPPGYSKAEALYSTAFSVACILAAFYYPSLPHAFTGGKYETLRALVTGFVATATFGKLFSAMYFVWPATYGDSRPGERGFWENLLR